MGLVELFIGESIILVSLLVYMQDTKDLILSVLCYGVLAVSIIWGIWVFAGAVVENIKDHRKEHKSYPKILGIFANKAFLFFFAMLAWTIIALLVAFAISWLFDAWNKNNNSPRDCVEYDSMYETRIDCLE